MFQASDRLGDIVARFPGSGAILKEQHIDYCCNGGRSIEEAAVAQGTDAVALLARVNEGYDRALAEGGKDHDWEVEPLGALVDHVLQTHHVYLQKTMPVLGELTNKILRVHGKHHGEELGRVHKLFNAFRTDMEAHMIKEEERVFPLIVQYERSGDREELEQVVRNIAELEAEHQVAGDLLHEIAHVTSDYHIPEDACGTYAYTYEKLEQVEEDTFRHVHLENNILFPRLRALLEPAQGRGTKSALRG